MRSRAVDAKPPPAAAVAHSLCAPHPPRHAARRVFAVVVLTLVVLGGGLRVLTLTSANPYTAYVDEHFALKPSARQIADMTWDAREYYYPTFVVDATSIVASTIATVRGERAELRAGARDTIASRYIEVVEPWSLVLAGRLVILALSVATIALVALLGARLAGRTAGILSAVFVAVLPIFVTRGSVVIVDTAAACFATATLYCVTRLATSASDAPRAARKWMLFGSVSSALAFTSKYTIGSVLLAVLVAVMLQRHWSLRRRVGLVALAFATFAVTAIVVMPALVLRTSSVVDYIRFQDRVYRHRPPTSSYWQQLLNMHEFGGPLLFVALVGLVLLARSRATRTTVIAFAAFAVATMVVLLRAGFQPVRNVLPLVPFLAVAAAVAVVTLARALATRLSLPRAGYAAIATAVAVALCWSPFRTGTTSYLRAYRARVDSRVAVRNWLTARVRPEDRVLVAEEVSMLTSELRRVCAQVVVGSQRLPEPLDQYDWVVLGEHASINGQSAWEQALATRPAMTAGDYALNGGNNRSFANEPIEQVFHFNRERVHVYALRAGPLPAPRSSARCATRPPPVRHLDTTLPLVIPHNATVSEGDSGQHAIHIECSLNSSRRLLTPITVSWRTLSNPGDAVLRARLARALHAAEATPGIDYQPASGTITFAPGQTSATITLWINGDTIREPDKVFPIAFTAGAETVQIGGLYGVATVTIRNDD